MRIGLIARCDDSGLGNQTYEFYRHMNPDKVMAVDFQDYNPLPQYPERYPDAWRVVRGFPKEQDCQDFAKDVDVIFTCEMPYNYRIFSIARERGIKTVLQYNWEFLDYLQHSDKPAPDLFAAPTSWMFNTLPQAVPAAAGKSKILRVPVNRDLLKPREITQAKTFMHIAGRPAHMDRNGTLLFIEALRHVKSPITAIIKCQDDLTIQEVIQPLWAKAPNPNVTFITYSSSTDASPDNYSYLYQETYKDQAATIPGDPAPDVLVLPRRYGGLCLPMQEALSVGMPVIMPDIAPNRDYLPGHWLVPAKLQDSFMARTTINVYEADVQALTRRLDWFAGLNKNQMAKQNTIAKEKGAELAWEHWKPEYSKTFNELLETKQWQKK